MMKLIQKFRERKLQKSIRRAAGLLKRINGSMKRLGWSRQRRRQFWRDFSRSPRLQDEIFDGFMKAK